jgi:hypothetical protein
MKPWIYLPPVEIPGVGQVHGHILEDAATWAEYDLETSGAAHALGHKEELQAMIDQKTWRSVAAFDVLTRIERELGDGLINLSKWEHSPGDEQREEYGWLLGG